MSRDFTQRPVRHSGVLSLLFYYFYSSAQRYRPGGRISGAYYLRAQPDSQPRYLTLNQY